MFEQPDLFGPKVLTVSGVTQYLRALLESDEILRDVWIAGEISTLSTPSSGHVYFTVKDSGASMRCVIWRTQAARLRMKLQSGMAVEVHGYVSLYEAGGQYQLYVDAVRLAGEGFLYQEFMRLKARLEAEGLFDMDRKRPLPAYPNRIGIVTSPTGAALQDMLNTLRMRYPLAEVILAPSPVQGEEAPAAIVKALQVLARQERVDVILLARGGGSMEDLWAFNDERVVRAVATSPMPVVTGIGHETDFTLADFAADVRAPTPTGAAVTATPDAADLKRGLIGLSEALEESFKNRLWVWQRSLDQQRSRLSYVSPLHRVQNNAQRLDELAQRLDRSVKHHFSLRAAALHGMHNRLETLNPMQVLKRGFAVVRDENGHIVKSVRSLQHDHKVNVRLSDGEFTAQIEMISPLNSD
ncbi:MAG: exodeoxyribonuclease VII large subunit [Chloroflexi bacterium HGW-Chloroflexi-10]|nr:MAG: exodeoxyribonuclease VII large subunit [Chloroflexi bacterium HGW-Chloroflexi-10]